MENAPAEARPSTPAPRLTDEETRAFAIAAARIAAANKAENVRVLDLRGLSNLADVFVIGTGTSNRQMHAIFNEIADHARQHDRKAFSHGDSSETTWLLVDYVDVVIHLVEEQHRESYDLDGLWGDAPEVEWREGAPDGGAA